MEDADDEGGKWLVPGGRMRAQRQKQRGKSTTQGPSRGTGNAGVNSGACFSCGGMGHKKAVCPNNKGSAGTSAGASTPARRTTAGKKPPPPRGPPASNTGAKNSGSSASTTTSVTGGSTANTSSTTGRKRGRDTSNKSGLTPPTKMANTRFSYASAANGGQRVVLVRLDGTTLMKADATALGGRVNQWSLEMASRKDFHEIPEISEVRATTLGLEVTTQDAKSASIVRKLAAKENLRALTDEEVAEAEKPRHKYSGFMRGEANANLTVEAIQLLVDAQKVIKGIDGTLLVNRVARTDTGCIVWMLLDAEAVNSMATLDYTLNLGFSGQVKLNATANKEGGDNLEGRKKALIQEKSLLDKRQKQIDESLSAVVTELNSRQFRLAEGMAALGAAPNSSTQSTCATPADTGDAGNSEAKMDESMDPKGGDGPSGQSEGSPSEQINPQGQMNNPAGQI